MKRKNILKFVSLLGIGSFVMLAATSCTSATAPTPNPTPNPEPKPDPMPNPPSGGMNDGNTNPGMDTAAQELASAKAALTTLTNRESEKVGLYVDYAKIKADLTSAYTVAKTTSDSSTSTLDQVKTATSKLQTAIDKAASDKQKFEQDHKDLLMPYSELKTTLSQKNATVVLLNQPKYSAILNKINSIYAQGEEVVIRTLDPVSGAIPTAASITKVNDEINKAISENQLKPKKDNADAFANYQFFKLDKTKIMGMSTNMMKQPQNYSFVGYSVGVTGMQSGQTTIPNWNFAQRIVWSSGAPRAPLASQTETPQAETPPMSAPQGVEPAQQQGDSSPKQASETQEVSPTPAAEVQAQQADTEQPATSQGTPLTDVSWIYSLSGTDVKYTFTFNYFGPSMAYLYFPYKLVKSDDSVGLQYKLNNNNPVALNFGSETNANGPAASVDNINVAKVNLANLNFGENTIEFSVPMNKVAPMIGNMYITSDVANQGAVYNQIFGNTNSSSDAAATSVTVDMLKGYSLASDWSTVISQYAGNDLTVDNMQKPNEKFYLVGYVGGKSPRTYRESDVTMNVQKSPAVSDTNKRDYIFYVNAPKDGAYSISGVYISGTQNTEIANSWLQFKTGDETNVLQVETPGNNNTEKVASGNWTTKLATFDTARENTKLNPEGKKTLNLKAGLNKIIVNGKDGTGDAPNFGNITFTLMNPSM
ncbi:variably expressed lipoprotein and hemagglutinin(VlhA) family protein [Mycoplasmoides gallisepticum S6]|uniref:Variably expressed lipoprotein and hemagglutinin(VlhA) family protein n=2 Tax=Mycoplasmoides gallisepticum TaxID=2096 RepID=A0A0F6CL77_MYCGL|nr:FIVAR domain-containing protein [Mycoplasmoides gallisepticum]AHB99849.1 variably expressed lipoprotein and hemagglutinin(VlhA) family protein [Mycoplasmoides gallisepticum S6]